MIKAVLFDLDGTLVDSIKDLTNSMNSALKSMGFPSHSEDECRLMIGDGLRMFCSRALPDDRQDCIGELMLRMKTIYKGHYLDNTAPFNGIIELCNALKAKKVSMAVVTNKDQSAAVDIVSGLFDDDIFDMVVGASKGNAVKPDPSLTLKVMNDLGVKGNECLFVGDSGVDIETAKRAGVCSVGVSWGLRGNQELIDSGADHIIDKPIELLELVS